MNENSHHIICEKISEVNTQKDASTATEDCTSSNDEPIATRSTYASFSCFLNYTKMFTTRLAKDALLTLLGYCYDAEYLLPNYIVDLVRAQRRFREERESSMLTFNSSREQRRTSSLRVCLRKFLNAFKSYVLSSEDDVAIGCAPSKDYEHPTRIDREPVFVIVDSSCSSNPSSKELLIDNRNHKTDILFRRCLNKKVTPVDVPSTSKGFQQDIVPPQLKASDSIDELLMIDINLQSENEILVDDGDDNESIVVSYLKNRDAVMDVEGISDSSLDAGIPSYPGSPRIMASLAPVDTSSSVISFNEVDPGVRMAIDFLQQDHEYLIAAETGNERVLQSILRKGTNIQLRDHLGRNALHLAVVAGDLRVIKILLAAGVDTNVKDSVGMTPLSLCLMRRPSLKVAKLLFEHGAQILPRMSPMDTGLFLQFVMMSIPTREEEKILRLLVEKGAIVNDPEAPGGRQALHFAAMSNNCDLIEILIDLGADLYVANYRNETPKEIAAIFKCKEAFNLLAYFEDFSNRDI